MRRSQFVKEYMRLDRLREKKNKKLLKKACEVSGVDYPDMCKKIYSHNGQVLRLANSVKTLRRNGTIRKYEINSRKE